MAQETFNTRLAPDMAKQLDEYHKEKGIPKVQILDKALREYFEKHKDQGEG